MGRADKAQSIFGSPSKALKDLWRIFSDVELRGLLFYVVILLLVGVTFYMVVEGWDFVEAFYFSVATLTTVGYGDLHPTNDLSRVFTAIYVLIGVGFILSSVMTVAKLANKPIMQRLRDHGRENEKREEKIS